MAKPHTNKFISIFLLPVLIAIGVLDIQAQNSKIKKNPRRSLYESIDNQAVKRVKPYYDYSHLRIKDDVVVRVVVDEKGDVISAKSVSGHPLLRGFAVSAAKDWKFAPKERNGKPVKNRGTITFHFPPDDKEKQ